MSRRIRTLAIRIAPVLAGLILAQASAAAADTQQPARPAQPQVQAQPQAQPQVQQRQVQQTYRRGGVTPPPIANMTLPSIGPSNYTVGHSERIYWGTAERHPAPQLYPQLPGTGQPAQTPPPVNTASVYRYLPPSANTSAAVGPGVPANYQNAMRADQAQLTSPFGPPLPATRLQQ